jgi:hypothetical protein
MALVWAAKTRCTDPTTKPRVKCRLDNLGTPETVATFLLGSRLAPLGSGKVAELLAAGRRKDSKGSVYYELEYQIRKEGAGEWKRHNIAVLCAQDDVLYTFNSQCSAAAWEQYAAVLRVAANSFVLRELR